MPSVDIRIPVLAAIPPPPPVPPLNPANVLTITNRSGAAQVNYPLQFGRPFVAGEIRHSPQGLWNGVPVPTQADALNRYPDGSWKYGVISLVIPSLPATGGGGLTFVDQPNGNNMPLTAAEMLDPAYDFDATISLSFPAAVTGVPNGTLATWKAVTNGSLFMVIDGVTYRLTGLDFSGITAVGDIQPKLSAAATAIGIPAYIDVSPLLPGTASITAINAMVRAITTVVPDSGVDIAPLLFASRKATIPSSSPSVSARAMLEAGDYTLWASGPIAQTIVLGDDTTARRYDIGNGDGYRPFRPRFYATFWPDTHQVTVRYVGENGLTTELEDLSYRLTLTLGNASPSAVYSIDLTGTQATDKKKHWSRSNWTKTFWIGGAPEQKIDIDHNLAYLGSTRFFPNFETSVATSTVAMATMSAYWTGKRNDLYDGSWNHQNQWTSYMGQTGGRLDISPYPAWTVLWMRTGDYRLRTMAIGMADIASAWPVNTRESDPTKNLSRDDPKGAGTGLGRVMSISDRPTIANSNLVSTWTTAKDKVVIVGPMVNTSNFIWAFDGAHQAAAFYPQYVLTGDPYYLQMMYNWAGYCAGSYDVRVPIGIITDQLRGAGWVFRSRAEVAFIAPDASPEKHYFTYLTNDALAQWESGFKITGTPFDGSVAKKGTNNYNRNLGPMTGLPPALHNWESWGDPRTPISDIINQEGKYYQTGTVGSITTPFMQWYVLYALARAYELGFASEALLRYTGKYLTDIVTVSGHPEMVAAFRAPVERRVQKKADGTFDLTTAGFMTLDEVVNKGFAASYLADRAAYAILVSNGEKYTDYTRGGAAVLVDIGAPGAVATWQWLTTVVYPHTRFWNGNQAVWAINPRTDTNVLPAISTYIPPVP